MDASQWQFTVQFMFVYFDSCNFNDCFTLVRTVLFLDVPNRECGDFVKKKNLFTYHYGDVQLGIRTVRACKERCLTHWPACVGFDFNVLHNMCYVHVDKFRFLNVYRYKYIDHYIRQPPCIGNLSYQIEALNSLNQRWQTTILRLIKNVTTICIHTHTVSQTQPSYKRRVLMPLYTIMQQQRTKYSRLTFSSYVG